MNDILYSKLSDEIPFRITDTNFYMVIYDKTWTCPAAVE